MGIPAINKHLANIFVIGEYNQPQVCAFFTHTPSYGKELVDNVGYPIITIHFANADESIWCTQNAIAALFDKGRSTIAEHLQNAAQ